MAFDNLLLERDGAVATITINRPKVLNALNSATIDELRRAILELKADAGARVAIGERVHLGPWCTLSALEGKIREALV